MTTSIKISCLRGFTEEKEYALNIITEFTGIRFEILEENIENYRLELPNGKRLIFKDAFFSKIKVGNSYLSEEFIPQEIKYLTSEFCDEMPVIFGDDTYTENENEICVGLDIVASVFFMISRWEETVIKDKDDHGRFPAHLSLASRLNFVRRPVVDEYVLLLKKIISKLDPSVQLNDHNPEIIITSDIDSFEKFQKGRTLKMFAGHILKRYNPFLFTTDMLKYFNKRFFKAGDPYNTFDRIMRLSDRFNTIPVFFVLTNGEGPYNDGWFAKDTKDVETFKKLAENGAGIGLHYGYFSLLNEKNIRSEKFELEKKYSVKIKKGRAHFLQFDIMSSFDILEGSGIKEDYSLGYSKISGFRCGTGRIFRPWDFNRRRAYLVVERSLIVMDTTLYAHNKMNKSKIKAELEYFIGISKKFNTDITILIHNSTPSSVFEAMEEAVI